MTTVVVVSPRNSDAQATAHKTVSRAWYFIPIILAGCCTIPSRDAVIQFRSKHPAEAKSYTYIYPVSLDTYEAFAGQMTAEVPSIATRLKRKFSDVAGVNEFADTIMKEQADLSQKTVQLFWELRQAGANGAAVCQFEWTDGQKREIGLLVLKSGEITRRDVWLWETIAAGTSNTREANGDK